MTRDKLKERWTSLKMAGLLTKEELKAGMNTFIYKQELSQNRDLLEKLRRG